MGTSGRRYRRRRDAKGSGYKRIELIFALGYIMDSRTTSEGEKGQKK